MEVALAALQRARESRGPCRFLCLPPPRDTCPRTQGSRLGRLRGHPGPRMVTEEWAAHAAPLHRRVQPEISEVPSDDVRAHRVSDPYFSGPYFTVALTLRTRRRCLPESGDANSSEKSVLSGRRDSNPRPSPWQGDALPTEPRPRESIILPPPGLSFPSIRNPRPHGRTPGAPRPRPAPPAAPGGSRAGRSCRPAGCRWGHAGPG